MLSLGVRKLLVLSLVATVFFLGHLWLVVSWLDEQGVIGWAGAVRKEYLTGTTITIIIALLILLVGPNGRIGGLVRRCPVCDHLLVGPGRYCSECGSKVSSSP
jgi:hypothetical protein